MTRAQELQDQIKELEDEWEEEVTTFVRLGKKPMKIVKRVDLPRGKSVFRNNKYQRVTPVPVVSVDERTVERCHLNVNCIQKTGKKLV